MSQPSVETGHSRPPEPDRKRALELLKRYGHTTCSFQALEPGMRILFSPGHAATAYADTGAAWVAAGEPIAAQPQLETAAADFCRSAKQNGKRPRFFAAERPLAEIAPALGLRAMPIGIQPVWSPRQWETVKRNKRSLREQLRRARAKGVRIRELDENDLAVGGDMRAAVETLILRWKQSRKMAQMGFVVELDVFAHIDQRCFFVAELDGRLVGLLVAVPVFARNGWFFEDVLRDPDAPNGTIELLFDRAMIRCTELGSERVTFGLAPLADVSSLPLRVIRDSTRWLYDFDGLYRFKKKLEPTGWEPVYLVYPRSELGITATIDCLRAFARGSFLRFAWNTVVQNHRKFIGLAAALLLPWTLLLALAPSRLFPSPAVQWGWVIFDVGLLVLLLQLLKRWRRRLAAIIAGLAAVDALLGCAQLIAYNMARMRGPVDGAAAALAIVAPAFVACLLVASARAYDTR